MDTVAHIKWCLNQIAAADPDSAAFGYATSALHALETLSETKAHSPKAALSIVPTTTLLSGEWGLQIVCTPNNKIEVIKELHNALLCGLKEAKDMIERPLGTYIIRGPEANLQGIHWSLTKVGQGLNFKVVQG